MCVIWNTIGLAAICSDKTYLQLPLFIILYSSIFKFYNSKKELSSAAQLTCPEGLLITVICEVKQY